MYLLCLETLRRKPMIELKINDFCRNCPDFEADVFKFEDYINPRDHISTIIKCAHEIKCIKKFERGINDETEKKV